MINIHGKTNKQIANEIKEFVNLECLVQLRYDLWPDMNEVQSHNPNKQGYAQPTFYTYYADYDWVVFCQLFGKMIDLPSGFPMYCIDLKQMLDEKDKHLKYYGHSKESGLIGSSLNIGDYKNYPKQSNEHNAISDALWNKKLHQFLTNEKDN